MDINESAPAAGEGKRRRRRRRRGGRRRRGNGQSGAPRVLDPHDDRHPKASSAGGGPEELTPFNLFCAYHLGITRDEGYRFQSVSEVARRFGVEPRVIRDRLMEYGIDTESLRKLGFDPELAQLDMRVAPEGISRRELARTMWAEFEDRIVPKPRPEEPSTPAVGSSAEAGAGD